MNKGHVIIGMTQFACSKNKNDNLKKSGRTD